MTQFVVESCQVVPRLAAAIAATTPTTTTKTMATTSSTSTKTGSAGGSDGGGSGSGVSSCGVSRSGNGSCSGSSACRRIAALSQRLSDETLGNIVHETRWLPRRALEIGAAMASTAKEEEEAEEAEKTEKTEEEAGTEPDAALPAAAAAATSGACRGSSGGGVSAISSIAEARSVCFGASAFGAGFGGSVWALVATERAADFAAEWRSDYENMKRKRGKLMNEEVAGALAVGDDDEAAVLGADGGRGGGYCFFVFHSPAPGACEVFPALARHCHCPATPARFER